MKTGGTCNLFATILQYLYLFKQTNPINITNYNIDSIGQTGDQN